MMHGAYNVKFVKYLSVIVSAWSVMWTFCVVLIFWFRSCRKFLAELNTVVLKSVCISLF